ncbi:MAG: hypothetical protein HY287_12420 [Planctomycetes bacterium]|nr:hypothetical protein [Planctomycetota bacterium]MBI3835126.1 hypothetical protein [Planctomycetota bacterium]
MAALRLAMPPEKSALLPYQTLEQPMINCLDCGYCLDGLERPGVWKDEYRCPECGRAFHPSNPQSFAINNSRGRPRRSGSLFLSVSLIGLGLAASVFIYPMVRRTAVLIYLAGLFTQFLVLIFRVALLNRFRFGPSCRAAVWISSIAAVGQIGLIIVLIALGRIGC